MARGLVLLWNAHALVRVLVPVVPSFEIELQLPDWVSLVELEDFVDLLTDSFFFNKDCARLRHQLLLLLHLTTFMIIVTVHLRLFVQRMIAFHLIFVVLTLNVLSEDAVVAGQLPRPGLLLLSQLLRIEPFFY